MRNIHLEAAIWNLFTSMEFFEGAAREYVRCDSTSDDGTNSGCRDETCRRLREFLAATGQPQPDGLSEPRGRARPDDNPRRPGQPNRDAEGVTEERE